MKELITLFIKRPVLSIVLSLLLLLLGLRAIFELPIREYPNMTQSVIRITTSYGGASAELIKGFITTPIQRAIASADGIDYITANSDEGVSIIDAHLKLDADPDIAFTNIMSKVSETRSVLPEQADSPVISKGTGQSISLLYIAFNSKNMSQAQISDYIARVVQPQLETITGVAQAEILGNNEFAMRIWLNPEKMAALAVSASDIAAALKTNNFLSSPGKTKGEFVASMISINTDLHDADEFKQIIIKQNGNAIVRLQDVANIQLGAVSSDSSVIFNGEKATFVGILPSPTANPLTVIREVKKTLPSLEMKYPNGLESKIVYDATAYIASSIKEVILTLFEATLIVIVVIYCFLGAWRSVLIPVVTIPLSLIGVCSFMFFLGYSINLLTLLAMVLAIGLVVDDAIVVVENIHRHKEAGVDALTAAISGAKEIASPVLAMTITLACVYAPIGFMQGLTGALFKEFAFTLASSVIISGFIALVLSPMMCARLFAQESKPSRLSHHIDNIFHRLCHIYQRWLRGSLFYRPVSLLIALTALVSCYFLYISSPQELAPEEDQSVLFISATAPQQANIDFVEYYTKQFYPLFTALPEMKDYFIVNGMGSVNKVIAGLILKPWDERTRSQKEIQPELQNALQQIPGLNTVVFPLPSLPIEGGGLPVSFIITSTGEVDELYRNMANLQAEAMKSGLFIFVDSNLKFNKPQLKIVVDRDKAMQLGINMQELGGSLTTLIGGNGLNRFSLAGRSYFVIPQVEQAFRLHRNALEQNYIKTASGNMIPLSSVAHIEENIGPNQLPQFQQLNAATLQGMMMPGKTLGEGLDFLQATAKRILPKGYGIDYSGQSRRLVQEGHAMMLTFFFALIIIYLVLAALFESFRDPFIIIISVPLSICGALIPINLGLTSINIFSQIGLVTLVGLITKHGILLVQFANQLCEQGHSPLDAIIESATKRLRPILMTTFAMILGVVPLILADGAGAASRSSIGIVIASGMSIGTLFTLFIVPMMYLTAPSASRCFSLSASIAGLLSAATLINVSTTLTISLIYAAAFIFCLYWARLIIQNQHAAAS